MVRDRGHRSGASGALAPRSAARAWLRAALFVALALCAAPASAQGGPGGGGPPCDLLTASYTMTFAYAPFGATAPVRLDLTFTCPRPARVWVSISGARVMTGAAGPLGFELWQDAGRTSAWPDASPVPFDLPDASSGSYVVSLWGSMPPQQDAAAGTSVTTPPLVLQTYAANLRPVQTVSLSVEADVARTCIIDPATLAFGSYEPVGANGTTPRVALGAIRIACTGNTGYAVGLGLGGNPAGTERQMANGAHRLRYELYSDTWGGSVWSTTARVSGTAPSTAAIPLPVYGRIAPGQFVGAGAYQDVVVSTIDF